MPDGALLIDRAYFKKPEWENQAREGGFTRGAAWLDLLALTNQAPTTTLVRGIQLPVERTQCAWSKLGLANRWGRSQGWVTATLALWEKDGRIRIVKSDNETTIIQVVNYDAWQDGLLEMLRPKCEQMESRLRTKCEHSETEKGEGRRDTVQYQGEKGEGSAPTLFTFEGALKHFGPDSGYTPDQVREQWLYYHAQRDPQTGDWRKPRGQTGAWSLITDPRSELEQALLRFADKKNPSAPNGVSASVTVIQLEKDLRELEESIQQDRQTNQPRDPKKIARRNTLREQLARLKPAHD